MLSNKAVTCQRCLNSVLIVTLSLFLSICPPLWTSISSSDTRSAGKHVFYSNAVRRGLTPSECGFSGKITILFQQMIQQISGFCQTSCVMNYNVKNWNRNAITVHCLTWEIRIRAADSQKLSASVYIPWNAGRLLQRFEMSPQRLFVQTEKTTLSMYIILQAGARSGAADAFHKVCVPASVWRHQGNYCHPPEKRLVSAEDISSALCLIFLVAFVWDVNCSYSARLDSA